MYRYLFFIYFLILSEGIAQNKTTPIIKPQILKSIPHASQGFTQGLFLYKDQLWESTGLQNQSRLVIQDLKGNIKFSQPIQSYFAEGLSYLEGELVQLTWTEGIALRYQFPSLTPLPPFKYSGEGWGLTTYQGQWVMSNGSDTLYFRNKKFEITRKISVENQGVKVRLLNELELAKGWILANIWFNNAIALVDPKSGKVHSLIDATNIIQMEKPTSQEQVLNGIAYDSKTDRFYITGKNWKNIYLVKIPLPSYAKH